MGFCPTCGGQVRDGAAFCPFCGARLQVTTQRGNVSPQVPAPGYGVPPMAASQAWSAQTPLSMAWEDWKTSPGKWGIVLKMALFQLLPGVGSLVFDGNSLSWGRECALGRRELMNQKLVRPGILDTGLYVYGVGVVVALVVGAVMLLLASVVVALGIPLSWFVFLSFLAGLVCSPLVAVMRMVAAICGRMRDGLSVSRAWQMLKTPGKTGKLFAAVWVPSAISLL